MISEITSTGSYVPEKVVGNEELSQFPSASIPLIASKTGVRFRRFASEDQCTSDLAAEAAIRCLANSGVRADELDGVILATSSPDQPMPATCARVQAKLGAWNAYAFDVNAVCTGAVYALRLADAQIRSGQAKRILVIAAEVYSRILNPEDFSTYPYFGDGAGAMLLVATETPTRPYIGDGVLHSDGRGFEVIKIHAGGSRMPVSRATNHRHHYFQMNGRTVFEFAIARGSDVIDELCQLNALSKDQIRHVVAHQANINILNTISQKSNIPIDRFEVNLDRYGNTAAASTLIAFDELVRNRSTGKLEGHCIIVAFGGGLTWGGILIAQP